MPFKSDAQRRFFHAAKNRGDLPGVNLKKWDRASKGKDLPERAPKRKEASASTQFYLGVQELMLRKHAFVDPMTMGALFGGAKAYPHGAPVEGALRGGLGATGGSLAGGLGGALLGGGGGALLGGLGAGALGLLLKDRGRDLADLVAAGAAGGGLFGAGVGGPIGGVAGGMKGYQWLTDKFDRPPREMPSED